MLKQTLAGCLALLAAPGAWAIGPGFTLAGYYEDSSAEVSSDGSSVDLDSEGYGVRGMFKTDFNWIVTGEFTALELDDTDVTDSRVGLGYEFDITPLASFYGNVEYVVLDVEGADEDTGVGVYAGGEVGVLKLLSVHARAGYLELDQTSGPELILGGTVAALPFMRLFAEYRWLELEDDAGDELSTDGFRVGVRLAFNS